MEENQSDANTQPLLALGELLRESLDDDGAGLERACEEIVDLDAQEMRLMLKQFSQRAHMNPWTGKLLRAWHEAQDETEQKALFIASGFSPLLYSAVLHHDEEQVRALLELGADTNEGWARTERQKKVWHSPLSMAMASNQQLICSMLLDRGCDLEKVMQVDGTHYCAESAIEKLGCDNNMRKMVAESRNALLEKNTAVGRRVGHGNPRI